MVARGEGADAGCRVRAGEGRWGWVRGGGVGEARRGQSTPPHKRSQPHPDPPSAATRVPPVPGGGAHLPGCSARGRCGPARRSGTPPASQPPTPTMASAGGLLACLLLGPSLLHALTALCASNRVVGSCPVPGSRSRRPRRLCAPDPLHTCARTHARPPASTHARQHARRQARSNGRSTHPPLPPAPSRRCFPR